MTKQDVEIDGSEEMPEAGRAGTWLASFSAFTFAACSPTAEVGSAPRESFDPPAIDAPEGTVFRGSFSADGLEFYYFEKVQEDEDYRILRTRRTANAWSEPEILPLGDSTASSMYPTVSRDGSLLVFSSYRGAGGEQSGNANLWLAHRVGSSWSEPELLEGLSTPENYDASPWFGPDDVLRFSSTSPDWSNTERRLARRIGEGFSEWMVDDFWNSMVLPLETHHMWSGITNPDATIAVVELAERGADGLDDSDLWVSRRADGEWGAFEPLGPDVNTEGVENFATFAPDGSTLVFVRDFSAFHSVQLGR